MYSVTVHVTSNRLYFLSIQPKKTISMTDKTALDALALTPTSDRDGLADFEASLQELEQIVTRMEQGQLSLEQSLTAFETGVKLTRNCQETLKKAEQRVNVLVQKAGDAYELRQAELRDADV